MDGDTNLICEKKKRLFGIQNKHLCSCYSGNFSPSSNFHINLMNAVFLDSHLLAILARLFETMLNKISLFICVWMENIQSQQWLRMRALRMCLAVVVRGIQWLEKKLMAGNNRFIRVENLFDKIHAHKLIHSHMSGIKSIVKWTIWPKFLFRVCALRCTFCHAKINCWDFSTFCLFLPKYHPTLLHRHIVVIQRASYYLVYFVIIGLCYVVVCALF